MTINNLQLTIDKRQLLKSQMSNVNGYMFARRGQTVVEVLVALAVAVILAVSLITTSLITQKSARTARNNTQATKLVQEYIEQIRVFRDRKGFVALSDGACFKIDDSFSDPKDWVLTPCPGEQITLNNTVFTRTIAILASSPNVKLITATATWNETGVVQTVTTNTYLSNWCRGDPLSANPCP